MHKGKRLLNLVRVIAFLVFVCAGSFLFCDIFNENVVSHAAVFSGVTSGVTSGGECCVTPLKTAA